MTVQQFKVVETKEQTASKTFPCEGCNTAVAVGKPYMRVAVVEDKGHTRDRPGNPAVKTARQVWKYHVTCWDELTDVASLRLEG